MYSNLNINTFHWVINHPPSLSLCYSLLLRLHMHLKQNILFLTNMLRDSTFETR